MDERYDQYSKFVKRVDEISAREEDEKKTKTLTEKLSGLANDADTKSEESNSKIF